jgi:putative hydrolase
MQAEKLGLKEIAITDHSYLGYNHIKPGDLEKMREDISAIKDKYKVKILLGIEANLISRDGDIDISDEELKDLDLVILGYHKWSRVKFNEFFKFVLPNFLRKKPSKAQIERNTEAYIKAMDKHRVSILAHLGYAKCAVDYVRLAKECVKRNIYIELNGKRINFDVDTFKAMAETGVKFIIDSDAHNCLDIAKNHRAFNLIEKAKVPLEQIAKWTSIPLEKVKTIAEEMKK